MTTNTENNVYHLTYLENKLSFDEDQAYQVLPVLYKVTKDTKQKSTELKARLSCLTEGTETHRETQIKLQRIMHKWEEKVKRLGGDPIEPFEVLLHHGNETCWHWQFPNSSFNLIKLN